MLKMTHRLITLTAVVLSDIGTLPASAQSLNEDFKLTAFDAAIGDWFGNSVAISGTTAIVGVYRDDDGGDESGSAYLFDTTTGQQLLKLTASDAAAVDYFGYSVAISGTTAIVGAIRDDDGGSGSGSVYGFNLVPSLVQQPQTVIVTAGETATFSVVAEDPGAVVYQWRYDGVDLADGGGISGTQTDTLQITTTIDDTGYYDCVVSNVTGATTSDAAALGVRPDPNACVVDMNGDTMLDFFDVSAFIQQFTAGCP